MKHWMKQTERLVDGEFPVCKPEEQGIPSRSILSFLDEIAEGGYELHGLEIIRNGYNILKFVPKPLTEEYIHRIYSSAKAAIITTAALFAIQENKLSFNDCLVDLFPECVPENIGELTKRITIYDLMNMSTGHTSNQAFYKMRQTDDFVRGFLSMEPALIPGQVFIYNNCAPHMISNAIKKVTGQWMTDYLKPIFFDHLDIKVLCDYNWTGDLEPTTISMSLESLTRISQFYLQGGKWNGKQLLNAELAMMVGKRHAPDPLYADELRNDNDDEWYLKAGYGLFATSFAGGAQFSGGMTNHGFVFRTERMAVAMLGNDRREEIQQIFAKHILHRTYEHQLEDTGWYDVLIERLKRTTLAPSGRKTSDLIALINRKRYIFEENTYDLHEIEFDFGKEYVDIRLKGDHSEQVERCGLGGEWSESNGYLIAEPDDSTSEKARGYEPDRQYGYGTNRFYHSGAWADDETFVFYSRSLARSCTIKFKCQFAGRKLVVYSNTSILPQPIPKSELKILYAWQEI